MKLYESILNRLKEEQELNKKLWDGSELKPEVADHLMRIVDEFVDSFNIDLKVDDVNIVGSNAGFNYKDKSDIDLHIITDFTQYPADVDIMDELFNAKKNNFNNNYDITIEDLPVELYIEDSNSPAESNGRYSLQNHQWLQQPEYIEEPEVNMALYDEWKAKIKEAIDSEDRDTINNMIDTVWENRKQDIKDNGFTGEYNLVFKKLRADGVLDELRDARHKVVSDELSL